MRRQLSEIQIEYSSTLLSYNNIMNEQEIESDEGSDHEPRYPILQRDTQPKRITGEQPRMKSSTQLFQNQESFKKDSISNNLHEEHKVQFKKSTRPAQPKITRMIEQRSSEAPVKFSNSTRPSDKRPKIGPAAALFDSDEDAGTGRGPDMFQIHPLVGPGNQNKILGPQREEQLPQLNKPEEDSLSEGENNDGHIRCECQYCHNMVFLDDLDTHEQKCEQSLSQQQIKAIQENEHTQLQSSNQNPQQGRQPAANFRTESEFIPINQMVPNRHVTQQRQSRYLFERDSLQDGDELDSDEGEEEIKLTTHPSGVVPQPQRLPPLHQMHSAFDDSEEEDSGDGGDPIDTNIALDELDAELLVQPGSPAVSRYIQEAEEAARADFASNSVESEEEKDQISDFSNHFEYSHESLANPFINPRHGALNSIIRKDIDDLRSGFVGTGNNALNDSDELEEEQKVNLNYSAPSNLAQSVTESQQPSRRQMILNLLGRVFRRGYNNEGSINQEDELEEGQEELDDESDDAYEELLHLDEDILQPVSKELRDELPSAKYTEANKVNFSEENKSCTICQCNYEVGDEYIILPCLHRFHNDCIGQWFDRKNTCPICKGVVGESSQVHQQMPQNPFPQHIDPMIIQQDLNHPLVNRVRHPRLENLAQPINQTNPYLSDQHHRFFRGVREILDEEHEEFKATDEVNQLFEINRDRMRVMEQVSENNLNGPQQQRWSPPAERQRNYSPPRETWQPGVNLPSLSTGIGEGNRVPNRNPLLFDPPPQNRIFEKSAFDFSSESEDEDELGTISKYNKKGEDV